MAENVKSVSWLPAEATNISYYRGTLNSVYEFDISEKGFFEWSGKWKVKPIDAPLEIRRYSDSNLRGLDSNGERRFKVVKHGYYFKTPPRGDGGLTCVAYDLESGRAYFEESPW